MIREVRLRNFRGFEDAAIELKPLTVLLGPNSSGKSSFGHALAGLGHAQWYHSGSSQASLTPGTLRERDEWPVDLGNYQDLCTTGKQERVYIGLGLDKTSVEFGFGNLPNIEDLRLSWVDWPYTPTVTTTTPISASDISSAGDLPPNAVTTPTALSRSATTSTPRIQLARRNEVQWEHNGVDAIPRFSGFLLTSVHHEGGTEYLLDAASRTDLESSLSQLSYLRATRERPLRGSPVGTGKRQPIGYSGEWTASLLSRKAAEVIQGMPPSGGLDDLRRSLERRAPLMDIVSAWLQRLQLAHSVQVTAQLQTVHTRVKLQDGESNHDISEVGFGVSQVLPVLVGGLLQPQNSLMIVDLPEAHLHPRPQGLLADFFCALAMSGRSSLVETHSEMFFHRLRLQCQLVPELRKQVAVYFIDPPVAGVCRQPRAVGLGFDDELNWPSGFLQEAWELEEQIAAARRK